MMVDGGSRLCWWPRICLWLKDMLVAQGYVGGSMRCGGSEDRYGSGRCSSSYSSGGSLRCGSLRSGGSMRYGGSNRDVVAQTRMWLKQEMFEFRLLNSGKP